MTDNSQKDNFDKAVIAMFAILVLLVNTCGWVFAYNKGGWAQLGLLIFLAPIYDVILLIIGIFLMRHLAKEYPDKVLDLHWLITISLPIIGYIGTAIFTFVFSKGGC